MSQWRAELLVKMRMHKITQRMLAEHLGLTPEYVNMVFAGTKDPKDAEQRFNKAVDEIIEKQQAETGG